MLSNESDAYVGSKTAGRILGYGQAPRAYKLALVGRVGTKEGPGGMILFSVADLVKVRDAEGIRSGAATG